MNAKKKVKFKKYRQRIRRKRKLEDRKEGNGVKESWIYDVFFCSKGSGNVPVFHSFMQNLQIMYDTKLLIQQWLFCVQR
jgi:hypothetical protein